MTIKLSPAAASAQAVALTDMADADASLPGTITIYSGTQPADGGDAVPGGAVALAVFECADPAFPNDPVTNTAGATSTAAAIAPVTADADGIATWFRFADGAGEVIFDGDVSESSGTATLKISTTDVQAGITLNVVSFTFTQPRK